MKRRIGLGGPEQVHLAEDAEREEMLDALLDMGFSVSDLEGAPDETLAAILRVYGSGGDEDEEDGEDEALDDLPEPKDDDEREEFAEVGRKWKRRGEKVMRHYGYADDSSKAASGRGHLLTGTGSDMDTTPRWDAAKYREEFKKNEQGLRQLGVTSPEELKRHREGRPRKFCDLPLPRRAKEGKGEGLADKYSEMPAGVRREAVRFAESRIKRGDAKFTGQSRQDYERIYLDATPQQRRELLGVS
jgi:hypothetical protein